MVKLCGNQFLKVGFLAEQFPQLDVSIFGVEAIVKHWVFEAPPILHPKQFEHEVGWVFNQHFVVQGSPQEQVHQISAGVG